MPTVLRRNKFVLNKTFNINVLNVKFSISKHEMNDWIEWFMAASRLKDSQWCIYQNQFSSSNVDYNFLAVEEKNQQLII